MITKSNLKEMLKFIGFKASSSEIYKKEYPAFDCRISVDFKNEKSHTRKTREC